MKTRGTDLGNCLRRWELQMAKAQEQIETVEMELGGARVRTSETIKVKRGGELGCHSSQAERDFTPEGNDGEQRAVRE